MTNKAWFALVAAGLFGALAMGGCVVGSGDDDDTGGTSGGGGTTSGGGSGGTGNSSSGGTGNSTSGGGTAGATGGSGGSTVSCDPTGSTPGSCTATDPNNTCQTCIESKCCTEYSACAGTNPDDSCSWGGPAPWPDQGGELACIQDCVITGGIADDPAIAACAGGCTTAGCATVSPQTSDMIACLKDQCFDECLQP